MVIEPNYKKPGDLIRSEEWNKILDELVSLRSYIEGMTRSATLTSLSSPIGKSYGLGRDAGDDFNYEALEVSVEYTDGNIFKSGPLFIHEWSNLRPKGNKNPFIEYLQSPNQHFWYRYSLVNPSPEKEIRYVTFRDTNPECAVRIANILHYTTRVKPLR